MSYLLDANALLALAWPSHQHHTAVHAWFKKNAKHGWATCALTQSAFVRIGMQPAFAGATVQVQHIADLLSRTVAHQNHRFLSLDFGFDRVVDVCSGGLWGHRQITDAWLLATAVRHGAKLLTFDTGIGALLATPAERDVALVTIRSAKA